MIDQPVAEVIAEFLADDSVGSQLGPYRVESLLGVGDMGEVYRATDTGLGRQVAIKILPADVSADPERLARLKREARILASPNHPNIGACRPQYFRYNHLRTVTPPPAPDDIHGAVRPESASRSPDGVRGGDDQWTRAAFVRTRDQEFQSRNQHENWQFETHRRRISAHAPQQYDFESSQEVV